MAVAQDLERYLIRIDATTEQLRRELRTADSAIATTERNVNRSTSNIAGSFGGVDRAIANTKRIAGGLSLALGAREIISFSDNITVMETRLRNVTSGTTDFAEKFDRLYDVARRNGDAFDELVGNYVLMNTALPKSISQTTDLVKVTEILSRGFAASGSSAQASSAVMTQLMQGLAGNFRNAAQEINSLIEGAPLLAKTIAEQLGGDAATDLKRFAEEGKLTTETMLQAILAAEAAIAKFEIPPAILRSWERIESSMKKVGGESRALELGAGTLAWSLDRVAENMDTIASGAAAAGAVMLTRYFAPMVEKTVKATTAQVQLHASIAQGNAVMIGSTRAAEMKAAAEVAASGKSIAATEARIAALRQEVAQYQINTAAIAQQRTAAVAYTELAQGIALATGRTEMATAAQAAQNIETRALIANNRVLQATTATLAAEEQKLTQLRVAHGVATTNYATAAGKATVASRALSGALALVGGPVGAAILGVAGAVYLLSQRMDESSAASTRNAEALDLLQEARDRINGKAPDLTENIRKDTEEKIKNTAQTLELAEAEVTLLEARLASSTYGAFDLAKIGVDVRGQTQEELDAARIQVEQLRKGIEDTRKDLDAFLASGGTKATSRSQGLSKEIEKLAKKQGEWSEELGISVEQAERLNKASAVSEDAYKAMARVIEVENELRQQGYKIGTQQYELRYKELSQLKELEAQTDANLEKMKDDLAAREKMAEELARQFAQPFENAAENIQDAMADTFEGIFDGSVNSADDAADAIKGIFYRLAAEMATLAIFRPSVFANGGLSGGLSGIFNGGASAQGATRGSGGIGDLTSLGGLLNGGLFSQSLAGIGNGLGNLLAGNSWSALPWTTGSNLPNIMGGAFGNMGYGAIGGLGANLLGLGSQNAVVNMLSGGLGTLAGGAIGTSMGTILGFAGGPIGAIAGGFLGTALGGLFGGSKPSNKEQWGSLNLADLTTYAVGGQSGKKFSQQNADFRDAVLGEASNLTQLLASVGGTTTGTIGLGIGSRDGLRLYSDSKLVAVYRDAQSLIEATLEEVIGKTTGLSDTMLRIIGKVGVEDTQKLAEGLAFGQVFDSFGKPAEEALSAAEEAMKALNATFDDYVDTAKELGFTIADLAKIEAERQKSLEELRGGFDSSVFDQIRGIVDPTGLAISQEMARYTEQLKAAQAIGADTAQVELLHQLQLLGIYEAQSSEIEQIAARFQKLSDDLAATRDSLLVGSLSTLTQQQQYELLSDRYGDMSARAQLGDEEALGALSALSKEFLQASQGMFGSTEAFADDFARVMETLELAKGTTDRTVSVQEEILHGQQDMTDIMQRMMNLMAATGNNQSAQFKDMADELKMINDNISRVLAG